MGEFQRLKPIYKRMRLQYCYKKQQQQKHSLVGQTDTCMPECETKDYSTIFKGYGKGKKLANLKQVHRFLGLCPNNDVCFCCCA